MADFDFDGVGGGFNWKIIPRLLLYAVLLVIGAFGSYWLGLQTGSFYLTWMAAMLTGIVLICSKSFLFPEADSDEIEFFENDESLISETISVAFVLLGAPFSYFLISVFKDSFDRDNSSGSTVAIGIFYGFFFGPLVQEYFSTLRSRRK